MMGMFARCVVVGRVVGSGLAFHFFKEISMDDKSNRGPADRIRVNVHEAYEVQYWTKALGCTAEELKAAVKAVGVMVEDVRKHLRK